MLPESDDFSAGTAGERGIALLLVLWTLALLAILVAAFSGDARTQLSLARNQYDAAAAQAIADAGVSIAILAVIDPAPAGRWRADGTEHALRFGGGSLMVSVQDEGGKIDLNAAPLPLLNSLFHVLGIAGADQLTSGIAAVRAARDDATDPALPAFLAVDDLRRRPGIERAAFRRIEPFITVYSKMAQFDPTTAPRAVLLSLPDATAESAEEFIARRTGGGAVTPDLGLLAGHGDVAAAPLRVFTVRSAAKTASGAAFVREAVVMLTPDSFLPYRFLSWRASYPSPFQEAGP